MMRKEHLGIRLIYYFLLGIVLLLIASVGAVLFIPLFLGFLLAFLANPLVEALERRRFSRSTSSIIVLLAGIAFVAIASSWGIPQIDAQVDELIAKKDLYLERFSKLGEQARDFSEEKLGPEISAEVLGKVQSGLDAQGTQLKEGIPKVLLALPSLFTYGVFVPIFALFFMIQGREMKKFVVSLIPNRYFEMTLMIVHKITEQLGGYVRGQFWDCFFVGLLAVIGLSIIGVKGAIPIGIFAGLANAVPYMGPVLGCVPAILSLLMEPEAAQASPWWTAVVVFIIVNVFDNILIYPLTVGKSLSLNPMMVMLGILFGGSVGGIPGMIIAVPLIGMMKQAFTVLHTTLKSYRII